MKIQDLIGKLKKTKDDLENQFWNGKGGDTLVKIQQAPSKAVRGVQDAFSPDVYNSPMQKFWGGKAGDTLARIPETSFGKFAGAMKDTYVDKSIDAGRALGDWAYDQRFETNPIKLTSSAVKMKVPQKIGRQALSVAAVATPAGAKSLAGITALDAVLPGGGKWLPQEFGKDIVKSLDTRKINFKGAKSAIDDVIENLPNNIPKAGLYGNLSNPAGDKVAELLKASRVGKSAITGAFNVGEDYVTYALGMTDKPDARSNILGFLTPALVDRLTNKEVAESLGLGKSPLSKLADEDGFINFTPKGMYPKGLHLDYFNRIIKGILDNDVPAGMRKDLEIPEIRDMVNAQMGWLAKQSGAINFGAEVGGDKIPVKNGLTPEDDSILEGARKSIGADVDKKASLKETWNQFYTDWVNRFAPIERLTSSVEKSTNSKILPEKSPEFAITRLLGAGGKAELRHKQTLEPIINQLGDISKSDFDIFLKANRDIELAGRGVYGSDAENAQRIINTLAKKYDLNKLNSVADQLYSYQRQNLEMLKESGILSDEAVKTITDANQKYVPFERVMDDVNDFLGLPTSKAQQGSQPIKKIKGSDRNILSPLESIIANTYKTESAVAKNRVAKSIVDLKKVLPDLDIKQVGDAEGAITVWENGKKNYYQVPADVEQAIKGLNEENVNLLVKIMSAPARLLRQQATGRNIDFMLPNVVKDQWDAAINSKYGYRPFIDYFSGLAHLVNYKSTGSDEIVEEWINGGGKIFFENMGGRKQIQEQVLDATQKKGVLRKLNDWVIGGIETVGEYSETPTRIGLYERAKKATGNPLIASKEAREGTLDFARMGAKMKTANSIIPFLNVGVQGFDKTIRTFGNAPGKTTLKLAAIGGLPALLTSVYNNLYQAEEYARIPDFEKEGNFIIVTGTDGEGNPSYLKIPKGHVQKLVANPTDHFVTWLAGNNPQSFSQLALTLFSDTVPILGQGDSLESIARQTIGQNIPQIIKPAVENVANYSFFKESPIVPNYMQSRPDFAQYNKATPGIYKVAGAVTGKSPLKIQNLAEGYLSGGIKNPVNLMETAISASSGEGVNINKIPVIRRFAGTYGDFDNERPVAEEKTKFMDRIGGILPNANAQGKEQRIAKSYGFEALGGEAPEGELEYKKYQNEVLKEAKELYKSEYIPQSQKDALLAKHNISPEELELDILANSPVIDRAIWVRDRLETMGDSEKQAFLSSLYNEKTLSGSRIFTEGVAKELGLEDLYDSVRASSKPRKLKIAQPPKIKFESSQVQLPQIKIQPQSIKPTVSKAPAFTQNPTGSSKLNVRDLYKAFDTRR